MTRRAWVPPIRMAAEDAKLQLLEAAAQLLDLPLEQLSTRDSQCCDFAAPLPFSEICRS